MCERRPETKNVDPLVNGENGFAGSRSSRKRSSGSCMSAGIHRAPVDLWQKRDDELVRPARSVEMRARRLTVEDVRIERALGHSVFSETKQQADGAGGRSKQRAECSRPTRCWRARSVHRDRRGACALPFAPVLYMRDVKKSALASGSMGAEESPLHRGVFLSKLGSTEYLKPSVFFFHSLSAAFTSQAIGTPCRLKHPRHPSSHLHLPPCPFPALRGSSRCRSSPTPAR